MFSTDNRFEISVSILLLLQNLPLLLEEQFVKYCRVWKGCLPFCLQVETTFNLPATPDERCGYILEVTTDESIDDKYKDAGGAPIKKTNNKKNKSKCRKKGQKNKGKKKKKKCKKTKENQQNDQPPNKVIVEVCAR